MNSLLRSLSLAALALCTALSTAAEPTAWEKISSFAHERKAEAVAEGRRMIAATDRQIAALKKEIARTSGEARKAHEANMKELQAKRRLAQAELNKMQQSAARTWDATKEGFSNAYRELRAAYDKATDEAAAK